MNQQYLDLFGILSVHYEEKLIVLPLKREVKLEIKPGFTHNVFLKMSCTYS